MRLSHRIFTLSIGLLALAAPLQAQAASGSPIYGRWTINEKNPRFTARGAEYKTVDIAPCGKDFCGVSVDAKGACGATLFRFLTKNNDGLHILNGHGKWGDQKLKLIVFPPHEKRDPLLELHLGSGADFGDRGGNMPKFQGEYRRLGTATCQKA